MACIALAAVSVPAFSATVTIAIVQNGTAPAIAIDTSRTIEDELFNAFFDAGHIVSNADIGTSDEAYGDPYWGVKDATLGDSDYLVLACLEYSPAVQSDTDKKLSWAVLNAIRWRVVRLNIGKAALEGALDVKDIEVMDSDPYKQSRIVADELGKRTLEAIRTIRQGERNK